MRSYNSSNIIRVFKEDEMDGARKMHGRHEKCVQNIGRET
jgi:hypothetical protein